MLDKAQSKTYSDTIQSQEAGRYVPALDTSQYRQVQFQDDDGDSISKKVTDLVDAGGVARMKEGQPLTKEDRDYSLIHSVTDKEGVVPGYGKVQLDQKFFDWAQKQEDLAFCYGFRDYVYKNIKLGTPEEREFWTTRFPEWTQRVYEAYEQQAEIDKRLMLISLHGIRDESDLWLLYMRDRGILYTSQERTRGGEVMGYRTGKDSDKIRYSQRPAQSAFERGALQQLPPFNYGFAQNK